VRYRVFGRTGLKISELGFGCGSVGGLIIRGDRQTRVKAVARAIELGVNYFDTAAIYGDGQSETNLGAALAELRAQVLVGTKVFLTLQDLEGDIQGAVTASLEASLRRLGREYVDLFQLHNFIGTRRDLAPTSVNTTTSDVYAVIDTFRLLREQGKIRFWGINGRGETDALLEAVRSVDAHSIQTKFNLLNPSAGMQVPPGLPYQDFQQLIDRAAERQMGVIAVQVLVSGALSGTTKRHPLSDGVCRPRLDYQDDVCRSSLFRFLVDDGYVGSLIEAGVRFAVGKPGVSTVLVGFSSIEQLEEAVQCVGKGPLPKEALNRIPDAVARQVEIPSPQE
jgi:aryl-alcohol dehydrogenase-like predicted oxidoreductase